MGKRMDDWLVNMGDWNISRRRYYGLPLPFYPCAACGHLTVIGSRAGTGRAGHRAARRAAGAAPAVDRRHHDRLRRLRPRGAPHPRGRRRVARRRHRPVLDARVGEPDVDRARLRRRRGGRADRRRPARPRLLGGVVPGRLGVGDARADPPVVLLAAVHVGRPHRPRAVPQGARLREDARRGRAARCTARGATRSTPPRRSSGWAPTSCAGSSASSRRRRTCCSASSPATRSSARCSRSGTASSFFTQYADVAGFTPSYADLDRRRRQRPPDGPLGAALTDRFVATATDGYERYLTVNVLRAFEQYVDDLSNWYIRRSRRRFWNGDVDALRTLWVSLVQSLRAVSPVVPFLTEHLWQVARRRRLRRRPAVGVPRRLAGVAARRRRAARPTSPPCAGSSSSAAGPAPAPSSRCASRCRGWSSTARSRWRRTTSPRSPRSCASRPCGSSRSRRPRSRSART